MNFDWNEYLEFAKRLNTDPYTQLNLRNAISRAYYAAFHKCKKYKRITKRSPEVHQLLIEQLKESDEELEIQIGFHLFDLRNDRNSADYDASFVFRKIDVDKRFEEVDTIYNNIDQLEE